MQKQEREEFQKWAKLKIKIHSNIYKRSFHQGEIWWIAMGENIGIEINGKGPNYTRPAIIFRKLSDLGCIIIPLTSQPHIGSWYVKFQFKGKTEYAVVGQIRTISTQRLCRRMGNISKTDYQRIVKGVRNLLLPKQRKQRKWWQIWKRWIKKCPQS